MIDGEDLTDPLYVIALTMRMREVGSKGGYDWSKVAGILENWMDGMRRTPSDAYRRGFSDMIRYWRNLLEKDTGTTVGGVSE